ncbi:DUF3332 domain-containing protein [Mangrovibacterium diazotrophicum]|uniref:Uncharacterized protein DUF3332 n=1 Tax=Mangrovibacterium diazotrophicum TaxID=1261403 RepID=A0A419W962_9BACT|nr:DUF3332 domain-containing protein [Mangrovibacterium diazotrophicum]RKD91954.1 uncharacterized protein DUF3332 [Mangrovibacterium diazotrophicum]
MKKVKQTIALLLVAVVLNGCYGSFKLTTSLWDWNGTVGDKFVNELVFLAFVIIPVYEVAAFVDAVVLNTIEFWGGSNPMSMKEGEKEQKVVEIDGKTYRLTAEKDKMTIEDLNDSKAKTEMIFNEDDNSWYLVKGKKLQKLVGVEIQDGKVISYNLYYPDGSVQEVQPGFDPVAMQKDVQTNMTYALQ